MADRPILFSAPMVRAILDGRKTMTRRVLGLTGHCNIFAPGVWSDGYVLDPGNADWRARNTPYAVGDRLWVREAWCVKRFEPCLPHERDWQSLSAPTIRYLADGAEISRGHGSRETGRGIYHGPVERGRPSIHMPRWASRLTLTVTDVRVERLQDISGEDAIAEGVVWQEPTEDDFRWARENDMDPEYVDGVWTVPGAKGFAKSDVWGCTPEQCFRFLWRAVNGPDAWNANPWVAVISFDVIRANIDAEAGE